MFSLLLSALWMRAFDINWKGKLQSTGTRSIVEEDPFYVEQRPLRILRGNCDETDCISASSPF